MRRGDVATERSRSMSACKLPTLALRWRNCRVGRWLDSLASFPGGAEDDSGDAVRMDFGGEDDAGAVGLDKSTHEACEAVRVADGSVERVRDSRRRGELGERCGETEDNRASGGFWILEEALGNVNCGSASGSVSAAATAALVDGGIAQPGMSKSTAGLDMQGAVRRADRRARRTRASVPGADQAGLICSEPERQ